MTPADLSRRLSEIEARLKTQGWLAPTAPFSLTQSAGNNGIGGFPWPSVAAQITDSSGSPAVYTAKQRTADTDNTVVDTGPEMSYYPVLSPTEATLSDGDQVLLVPIADRSGWWWAYPVGGTGGDSSFLAVLTDIFIPGLDSDSANCYDPGSDSGQFYTYSWVRLDDSGTPVKVTYSETDPPVSGNPCSSPAFHVRNQIVPVMRASGLADVTDCPDGASIGYKFTLSGLTGSPCTELNGLEWIITYAGSSTWTGTQTTLAGTTTATLVATGGGAGDLTFTGAIGATLEYEFSPWPCTGDVTMTRIVTGPCSGTPDTLDLTAQLTVPLFNIDPLSVVRMWKGTDDYYLFDVHPWVDLFRLTPDSDLNGIKAFLRFFDQSDQDSGDMTGGTWIDGRTVRVVSAG